MIELNYDNFTNESDSVSGKLISQKLISKWRRGSMERKITIYLNEGISKSQLKEFMEKNYENFNIEEDSNEPDKIVIKWIKPEKKQKISKETPKENKKEDKKEEEEVEKNKEPSSVVSEFEKKLGEKKQEPESKSEKKTIKELLEMQRKETEKEKLAIAIKKILNSNKFVFLGEKAWKGNSILDNRLNLIDLLNLKGFSPSYDEILTELNKLNAECTNYNQTKDFQYLGMIKSNLLKKDGDKFVFSEEELEKARKGLGFDFPTDKTLLFVSLIYDFDKTNQNISIEKAKLNYDQFISLYLKNGDREKAILGMDVPQISKKIDDQSSQSLDTADNYLFSFRKQNLFPTQGKSIMDYIDEIIEYMNGSIRYVCKCGWKFDPSDSESKKLQYYSKIFITNDHNSTSVVIIDNKGQISNNLLEEINKSILNKTKINGMKISISKFAENQSVWRNLFKCPKCQKSIFKDPIFFINKVVYEMINAFRNAKPPMLVGNPGDGKSMIGLQILEWCEWKYDVGFNLVNVDESTSAATLRGGFSPLAIGGGEDVSEIRYGEISKCLLNPLWIEKMMIKNGQRKRGGTTGESCGKNILIDEMNRADFRNYAFLMGYFEAPYKFILPEDDSREFPNPNKTPEKIIKWILIATMNTSDVGVESLSLAFKSRFSMITVHYVINEMMQIIRKSMYGLNAYEEKIARDLIDNTISWAESNDIVFPVGIRHLRSFLRQLRLGIQDLLSGRLSQAYVDWDTNYRGYENVSDSSGKVLLTKEQNYQLEALIRNLILSLIVMPIVDENNATVVQRVIQNADSLVSSCHQYVRDNLKTEYTLFTD